MRSLPPKDYQTMPRLDAPAGYICVMRDIDSDTFRIDSTDHPATLISAIMEAAEREFGIELISILESEDLQLSASLLYERHHARLNEDWLALDDYQIEELRRSILKINAHRSLYLARNRAQELTRPREHEPMPEFPRQEAKYGMLMTSNMGESGQPLWRKQQQPHRSRSLNSSARHSPRAVKRAPASDQGRYLRDRFLTLLIEHPFKVIFTVALLLVMCLVLGLIHGYHVTHNVAWR